MRPGCVEGGERRRSKGWRRLGAAASDVHATPRAWPARTISALHCITRPRWGRRGAAGRAPARLQGLLLLVEAARPPVAAIAACIAAGGTLLARYRVGVREHCKRSASRKRVSRSQPLSRPPPRQRLAVGCTGNVRCRRGIWRAGGPPAATAVPPGPAQLARMAPISFGLASQRSTGGLGSAMGSCKRSSLPPLLALSLLALALSCAAPAVLAVSEKDSRCSACRAVAVRRAQKTANAAGSGAAAAAALLRLPPPVCLLSAQPLMPHTAGGAGGAAGC